MNRITTLVICAYLLTLGFTNFNHNRSRNAFVKSLRGLPKAQQVRLIELRIDRENKFNGYNKLLSLISLGMICGTMLIMFGHNSNQRNLGELTDRARRNDWRDGHG